MEQRTGKIIVQAPGGTASKTASTYKVALPSTWVKEMGIGEGTREIELRFDGASISICKKQSIDQFIAACRNKQDQLVILRYYHEETLCSKIAANYTGCTLAVENYTPNILHTAFGNNPSPTWEDLQLFLEERCIPRTRAGLREYLEAIGVEEYDPLEIIKKTAGRMAEDAQWLRVEVAE